MRKGLACVWPWLVVLVLALAPTAASAHAVLLSTSPAANAMVETRPDAVTLDFNEPVSPLAASLIAADGSTLDLTQAAMGGAEVRITLPETVAEGTHVLSWRVVSADGHPIAGSLVFSIGRVTGALDAVAAPDVSAVAVLLWLSKVVMFAGLFIGVGGVVFGTIAPPQPELSRRVSLGLIVLGLMAAPLSLAMQGLDALGLPLGGITEAKTWATGYGTSYGATVIAACVAFGLALIGLLIRQLKVPLVIAAFVATALALALSGHASAAEPQWLTRPAVFLHIAGITFWVGALLPLAVLLASRDPQADAALSRFSRLIPYAIVPIVISGIALAVIQLGPFDPTWFTPYGAILAAKLVLLVALFGLAVWNRVRLTRPALEGNARARRLLVRSVRGEILLVLVVLALVAGWRFTPPPRALAEQARLPANTHIHTEKVMADVTITPGRPGPVDIALYLAAGDFTALVPQGVSVNLSQPQRGIEPIALKATLGEDGFWHVDDANIPVGGTWSLDIEVRVSMFELARLKGEIVIP